MNEVWRDVDQLSLGSRHLAVLHAPGTRAADVPISPHPVLDRMLEKAARARAGETPNPFIDPRGWRLKLREFRRKYRDVVARARRAGRLAAGQAERAAIRRTGSSGGSPR